MNLSAPFIARPVATTLLTIGIALAGLVAFLKLPVSPLPRVDFPTIQVSASLPGASPETVATSLTTPLGAGARRHRRCHRDHLDEHGRQCAHHPAVRPVEKHRRGGARRAGGHQRRPHGDAERPADQPAVPQDQSGRRAGRRAGGHLGHHWPGPPVRRGVQHPAAEAEPGDRRRPGRAGRQLVAGGARRDQSDGAQQVPDRPGERARRPCRGQCQFAQGRARGRRAALPDLFQRPGAHGGRIPAADHRLAQRRAGQAVRRRRGHRRHREHPQRGPGQRQALGAGDHLPAAQRQRHRDRRRGEGAAARAAGGAAQRRRPAGRQRPHHHHPRLAEGGRACAADQHHPGGAGDLRLPALGPRRLRRRGRRAGVADRHLRRHVSAGLQHQQPVADGHGDRRGLRGRRRHHRAGERLTPHRGRHGPHRCGPAGRARGRLHRGVDERVADRGVHSHPADAGHRRPAVPRVRRHALDRHPDLDGGVAHHHADDVRLRAAAA